VQLELLLLAAEEEAQVRIGELDRRDRAGPGQIGQVGLDDLVARVLVVALLGRDASLSLITQHPSCFIVFFDFVCARQHGQIVSRINVG